MMLLRGWFEAMEQRARCSGEATPRGEAGEDEPKGPDCILALDLKNAYGEFERAPALRAAEQTCKRAAMLAAVQWQTGETLAYVRDEAGRWHVRACTKGCWQGSRLAHTIVGLELEAALSQLPKDVSRVGVADDVNLAGPVSSVAGAWQELLGRLGGRGHKIQPPKCAMAIPGWDGVCPLEAGAVGEGDKEAVAQLLKDIPRDDNALLTLGSAAQGARECILGPWAAQAKPAQGRVDKARDTMARMREVIAARVHDEADQAMWCTLVQSVARALEYDYRLCPWAHLRGAAEVLCKEIQLTLRTLLGGQPLDLHAMIQVGLPTALGGMGVPLPTEERAAAAFLATYQTHAARMQGLSEALGRSWSGQAQEEAAAQARAALLAAGIQVRGDRPALTMAASEEYAAGPWANDTPVQELFAFRRALVPDPAEAGGGAAPADEVQLMLDAGVNGPGDAMGDGGAALAQSLETHGICTLFGRILCGLNGLQATRLHARLSEHRQQCLLSAGGPGVGRFWTMTPCRAVLRLPNAIWAAAFRRRLGIQKKPYSGCCCQIKNSGDGRTCGAPLDDYLRHPAVCELGGGRQRAHNGVVAILERILRAAGAFVEREKVVPELYVRDPDGKIRGRRLDLVVTWPGGERFLIDVSVRTPFALAAAGAAQAGRATRIAEADKARHYDSSVWAFAVEPSGRVGTGAIALLAALGRDAANLGSAMPGTGRPGRLREAAVRAEIEAEIAKCDAARALTALGCEALSTLGWAASRAAAPSD